MSEFGPRRCRPLTIHKRGAHDIDPPEPGTTMPE
jgi:hypothetical protein